MSGYLRIRWTITPGTAPRPLINCNRCGTVKPYRCSGKFRVNANGKRIDAWLIYRCFDCDNSWNFGILERCSRRDIAPARPAAPESKDPGPARAPSFRVGCRPNQGRRLGGAAGFTRSAEPARGPPRRCTPPAASARC